MSIIGTKAYKWRDPGAKSIGGEVVHIFKIIIILTLISHYNKKNSKKSNKLMN